MKRFAEDTKEYSKEKNWWENIPLLRKSITDGLIGNHVKNIIPNEPASQVAPIMKQRILDHVSESIPNDLIKKAKKIIKNSKNEKLRELEMKAKKKFKKERKKEKKEMRKQKKKIKRELEYKSSSSLNSSIFYIC